MKRKLLALLAGLLAATPALAQRHDRAISTIPQLTDSIQRLMARDHIPGLLLVLATRDSVLFAGGLGVADVATKAPVTPHTRFGVGSITKMLTAAALLQLVEQGKLGLNDEVRKIAPEVPIDNPWEATDPVRVVHLLEHTAGFDDMAINQLYNAGSTTPTTLEVLRQLRPALRCRWRPGERMAYANPGYAVAGYLLEKRSGQAYADYVTEHVLRPLGMADARLNPSAPSPQHAVGYDRRGGSYQPVPVFPLFIPPAGCLSASATDMAQWLQLYLHDGRAANGQAVLQPATVQAMETVHTPLDARQGLQSGYGLANCPMSHATKVVFRGHGGNMPGFFSLLGYNRAVGVGYVLSNNHHDFMRAIEPLVQAFLLRQLPRPAPASQPLDAAAVAPYLGHYQRANPSDQTLAFLDWLDGQRLEQRGPLLLLRPLLGGAADTLVPTGPLIFRRAHDQFASLVLARDHDGHRVLIANNIGPARPFYTQAGALWWGRPASLLLSVLLAAVASLAGVVWAVLALLRRLPRAQLWPRVLPLLASGALFVTVSAFLSLIEHIWDGPRVCTDTVLLFVAPLALAGLVLGGLVLTVRRFRQFRSRFVVGFLLLSYGALGWLAVLLGTYGWLGLRLWNS